MKTFHGWVFEPENIEPPESLGDGCWTCFAFMERRDGCSFLRASIWENEEGKLTLLVERRVPEFKCMTMGQTSGSEDLGHLMHLGSIIIKDEDSLNKFLKPDYVDTFEFKKIK